MTVTVEVQIERVIAWRTSCALSRSQVPGSSSARSMSPANGARKNTANTRPRSTIVPVTVRPEVSAPMAASGLLPEPVVREDRLAVRPKDEVHPRLGRRLVLRPLDHDDRVLCD